MDYETWFKELHDNAPKWNQAEADFEQDRPKVFAWLGEVRSALGAVFGEKHALTGMAKLPTLTGLERHTDSKVIVLRATVEAKGAVEAALSMINNGRVSTLIGEVRAQAEADVLKQAEQLAEGGHLAAATVLAGGAMEAHLRYLCDRDGISWPGSGSIAKYKDALAQARNAGTITKPSSADLDLVGGWGKKRNDAAHDPASFAETKSAVDQMVQGVRLFISTHP